MLLPLWAGAAWLKGRRHSPLPGRVETRQGCSTDSGLLSSSPPHHRSVAFQQPGGRKRACLRMSRPGKMPKADVLPKADVGASGSDSRPPIDLVASSVQLEVRLGQASLERSAKACIVPKSSQMKDGVRPPSTPGLLPPTTLLPRTDEALCALLSPLPLQYSFPRNPASPQTTSSPQQ